MSVTLIATPNAADANSFADVAYADAYWATRAPSALWTNVGDKAAALINATRLIVNSLSMRREYFPPTSGINARNAYFLVHETWTGSPATTTQALPWGRIGMYDRNGNVIPSNVIPNELKDATSEIAGQVSSSGVADRMLDDSKMLKGIARLRAGPVDISYRDGMPLTRLVPSVLWTFLVPSWLTEAFETPAQRGFVEVVSN